MTSVYHICPRADFGAGADYAAASLHTEGFIHASRREQLLPTAARFFSGQRDLLILAIDPQNLDVRWEEAPDGAGVFPHIYQVIPADAVLGAWPFSVGPDGAASLPAALP